MDNKVNITRAQAEFINKIDDEKKATYTKCFLNGNLTPTLGIMDDLTPDEFINALYVGYEIYPEFKLNDYAYNIYKNCVIKLDNKDILDTANGISRYRLRHATNYEIEKYWWNYYNRDIWELRTDDVLVDDMNKVFVITMIDVDRELIHLNDEDICTLEFIMDEFIVLCFAEQRLDK